MTVLKKETKIENLTSSSPSIGHDTPKFDKRRTFQKKERDQIMVLSYDLNHDERPEIQIEKINKEVNFENVDPANFQSVMSMPDESNMISFNDKYKAIQT